MDFFEEMLKFDGTIAQSEAMWPAVGNEEDLTSAPALSPSGTGSWDSTCSDAEDLSVHKAFDYPAKIPVPGTQIAPRSGSLSTDGHGLHSPIGSFAGSPPRPQLLDNAMRASKLRARSPGPDGAASRRDDQSAGLVPTLGATVQPRYCQSGIASLNWLQTAHRAPAISEWPHFGGAFSGADELDAHAAAVLASDYVPVENLLQHAEPVLHDRGVTDYGALFSDRGTTLAPVKVPNGEVGAAPDSFLLYGAELAETGDLAGGHELQECWDTMHGSALSTGTTIDTTFGSAAGGHDHQLLSLPRAEISEEGMQRCDPSGAASPRSGGYGSEDEWTPSCLKVVHRRPRQLPPTRGDGSDEQCAWRPAGGGQRRGPGARVPRPPGNYASMVDSYDYNSDDDLSDPATPPCHRRGGGGSKHRRAPGGGGAHDPAGSDSCNPRHKRHNPWTVSETEALVDGVERCGGAGRWQEIKRLEYHALTQRSAVDLKDKWRNLLRVANLPPLHSGSFKADKKRDAPSFEILARVRQMAAVGPAKSRRSNHGSPSCSGRARPRSWPATDMDF